MSYRAFKRLLGETSLERKCHLLFGTCSLLLITGSFFWYLRETEEVVSKQLKTSGRMSIPSVLSWYHLQRFKDGPRDLKGDESPKVQWPSPEKGLWQVWDAFTPESVGRDPAKPFQGRDYSVFTKRDAERRENQPNDDVEFRLLEELRAAPAEERFQDRPSGEVVEYYGAVLATPKCIECHKGVKDRDFMAMVRISIPTADVKEARAINRAVLISTALVTVLLLMAGSYVIVRYVIVKPVKHLKEVSDAISAGELNVRSEIQTGDEFEDLSHAFNRMLRNLVSMQDRLRKANTDLDHKLDELAQANLALFESNRLKSDFLATISHELRTPLNSILGFSDLLSSNDQLGEKPQRWAGNIRTSGERLLNLINDILDLAKIEAGKMEVHLEEFRLPDVCDGLLTMFRPLAEKKNIDVRAQLDPTIPPLRQDATKLQQILSNLLSNAIKFTPQGGRVLVRAEADGAHLFLSVQDTGVGIAPEDQEQVFDKFRQAGSPLTREHAGTGLGLSIVRELAKLLGGEVTLQSELGRGSTFKIMLPLRLSPEPRLEFDLAGAQVDLTKAQRVSARLLPSGSVAHDKLAAEDGVTG